MSHNNNNNNNNNNNDTVIKGIDTYESRSIQHAKSTK